MDLFERLRRMTKDVPWGVLASAMAENLGASTDAAAEVVRQLTEWGTHLSHNALEKWTGAILEPADCDSPDVRTGRPRPCSASAVVRCDACGRPCCLAHARIDYLGDAICEMCIGEAKARKRAEAAANGGPRPYARPHAGQTEAKPADPLLLALKALRLPRAASWAQIQKQYKKLVVKHNADRPQSDAARRKNTERLKEVNTAYAVLKAQYEGKAAA